MIIAAIPVRNNLKWTAPLVEQLLLGDDVDEVWIYDNGSTDLTQLWVANRSTIDSRLKYFPASDMRFYEVWNDMIRRAAEKDDARLAILNNDIRLPHMALKSMADNMGGYTIITIDTTMTSFQPIDNPHPVRIGGWWHRVGWAFMVNPSFWKDKEFAIDPRFNLWYGDDYLYRTTMDILGGSAATMVGVGCDHAVSQTEYPADKVLATEQDRVLFDSLWP